MRYFVSATAIMMAASIPAAMADFPDRELRGAIMWGEGGATDNVARALTPHVEDALGQDIVLQNRTGGVGAIATQYVFSQPADGYNLLYGAENPQLYPVLGLSDLDYRNFEPVSLIAQGPAVIVTHPDSPYETLEDLVTAALDDPGGITMGSTGPGGITDVIDAMMQSLVDTEFNAVVFDGEGPGLTDLQGGHLDFMTVGLTAARDTIEAGAVRALAVVAEEPIEGMDAPPITDIYPEFERYLPWGPFYGVFVHADTPDDVVETLAEGFSEGVNHPDFQSFISDFGAVTLDLSGEDAREYLRNWQSTTAWLMHEQGATEVSPEEFDIPRP